MECFSLSPWRHLCGMKFMQIQSDRAGHQREGHHSVDCAGCSAGDRLASAGWDGAGPLSRMRASKLPRLCGNHSPRLPRHQLSVTLRALHIKRLPIKGQPLRLGFDRETEFGAFVIFVSLKPPYRLRLVMTLISVISGKEGFCPSESASHQGTKGRSRMPPKGSPMRGVCCKSVRRLRTIRGNHCLWKLWTI